MGRSTPNAQRAWTTNGIVEQFERKDFSDCQVTKPCALAQVAPVEEDAAAISKSDEAVSLPEHQRDDAARAGRALRCCGPPRLGLASRRRVSDGASRVLHHVLPARF
jgi:hypothetical protein